MRMVVEDRIWLTEHRQQGMAALNRISLIGFVPSIRWGADSKVLFTRAVGTVDSRGF
jgi:hypothetical protein